MSVVQIAVDEVRNLSETDAQALLEWLAARRQKPRARKYVPRPRPKSRKQRMSELMAWYDSIRRTTNWDPPRMPNDLVGPPILFR
jgi:hypothetical protein